MAARELFSKRLARAARAGQVDVYQYDDLPQPFRVQVVHLWQRAVGDYSPRTGHRSSPPASIWEIIGQEIAEEHGLFELGSERDPLSRCANYFLKLKDTSHCLDVIERVFWTVDTEIRANEYLVGTLVPQHPDHAIGDLNARFREHSVGYQFVGGKIVRVDSQFVHAAAVVPAISLLQTPGFEGPEQEFLKAHGHYREGNFKEAINEANKAFESTLKSICDLRAWSYDENKDAASALLAIVFRNELIPSFLQTSFGGLRAVLEGGVPTTRNRTSGHGQGPLPIEVPAYLAAYVLHVTASNILLLVEAHRAAPLGELGSAADHTRHAKPRGAWLVKPWVRTASQLRKI